MRAFVSAAMLPVLALSLPTAPAAAQAAELPFPFSVEIRAGALVPLGDWDVRDREASLRVGTGAGLSGVLRMDLTQGISAYGSFGYARPSCTECGLFGLDGSLGESGFGFGVGSVLPLGLPVPLRLDLGVVTHRLSFRGAGETRPSNWGWGGEAGLAASFQVRPSVFVEPALAATLYGARFEFEEGDFREVNVRYLTPRVGLRYWF
jgi:hypothetical protein